jgi:hypothetical protein
MNVTTWLIDHSKSNHDAAGCLTALKTYACCAAQMVSTMVAAHTARCRGDTLQAQVSNTAPATVVSDVQAESLSSSAMASKTRRAHSTATWRSVTVSLLGLLGVRDSMVHDGCRANQ